MVICWCSRAIRGDRKTAGFEAGAAESSVQEGIALLRKTGKDGGNWSFIKRQEARVWNRYQNAPGIRKGDRGDGKTSEGESSSNAPLSGELLL